MTKFELEKNDDLRPFDLLCYTYKKIDLLLKQVSFVRPPPLTQLGGGIIWIFWVFCQFFQILSQNFELCSETNILSQQLPYLCRLLISGLRNAPMLSIWKNWQVIFLSSLSTARTKCRVKQYNSNDTPNFDVFNQN